jgi:hypothetical protein
MGSLEKIIRVMIKKLKNKKNRGARLWGPSKKSLEKNFLELIFHKAPKNYTNILIGSSK